jgi:hypothetical protein
VASPQFLQFAAGSDTPRQRRQAVRLYVETHQIIEFPQAFRQCRDAVAVQVKLAQPGQTAGRVRQSGQIVVSRVQRREGAHLTDGGWDRLEPIARQIEHAAQAEASHALR